MYLKIHDTRGEGKITAACDADLMGKTLKGECCDLTIEESFYGSKLTAAEVVEEALRNAVNANIIGKNVCALAIHAGIIEKADCVEIDGIPHAQMYRI